MIHAWIDEQGSLSVPFFHFLFRRYQHLRVLIVLFNHLIRTTSPNGEGRFWEKGINHISSYTWDEVYLCGVHGTAFVLLHISGILLGALTTLLLQHSFLCELTVFATITAIILRRCEILGVGDDGRTGRLMEWRGY